MSSRITEKQLEALADRINQATDSPMSSYVRTAERMTPQVGNFHISYAYGGACLHRMANESGGVHDVLRCGHIPKRELWDRMHAFLNGIDTAKGV